MSFFFTGDKKEGQPNSASAKTSGQNFSSMFDSAPASDNFMIPSSDSRGASSTSYDGGANLIGSSSSSPWKKPATSSPWAPTPSTSFPEFKKERTNSSTSLEFKLPSFESRPGNSLDTPKKLAVDTIGDFVEDNSHIGGRQVQGTNIGLGYSPDVHTSGRQGHDRHIGGSQIPQNSHLLGRHNDESHIDGGKARNCHNGGRPSQDSLTVAKQGQGCHISGREIPEKHTEGNYVLKTATPRKDGEGGQSLPPADSEGSLKRRVSEQPHDMPSAKQQHVDHERGKQDDQQQQYLGEEKAAQMDGKRTSGGEENVTKSSGQGSVLKEVQEKEMYAGGDLPSSDDMLINLLEQQREAVGRLLPSIREGERREQALLDSTRQVSRDIQEYSARLHRIKDQYRKRLTMVSGFLSKTPGQ